MKWRPYADYTATGIHGLEQIPAHWEIRKLKLIADVRGGVAKGKDLTGQDTVRVPYLRVANVQDGYLNLSEVEEIDIPERELDRYLLQPGDVLMNEGGDFDKLGRGCVWKGEVSPCIHQNHVFSVRPHRVRSEWLSTVSGSAYAQFFFMGRAKQSTNLASISATNLAELPVVMPPAEEQDRMLSFLDRETAKIDALIAEQRTLVGHLGEKRQATIHSLVTKGVIRGAKLKDSGQEWIGMIPEHWGVSKIKQVARLESGHTPSRQHPEWWLPEECTVPWISLTDVGRFRKDQILEIFETNEMVSPLGLENSSARLLPEGTVVVSRTASVGFSVVMGTDMATTQDFANWVCGTNILPLYLLFAFRSMRENFRRLIMGSTHQTIYMPDIAAFTTPLPPLEEQRAIIEQIKRKIGHLDQLVLEAETSIALLQEHRSALITAVVTGKVDVREVACV